MFTPSGLLTIIALPIVTTFTVLFWYYRKRYPIADRHPWMGITVGCLVMVADIMQLYDSQQTLPDDLNDKPCSLPLLTIHTFLIPYGICTFVLRTWLLLFRFEITADLQGRNGTVAGASLSSSHASGGSMIKGRGGNGEAAIANHSGIGSGGGGMGGVGGLIGNSGIMGQPRYQPLIGHNGNARDDVMVSVSRPSQPAAIISTIGIPSNNNTNQNNATGGGNNTPVHGTNVNTVIPSSAPNSITPLTGAASAITTPTPAPLSPAAHLAPLPSSLPLFTSTASLPSSSSPLPTPSAITGTSGAATSSSTVTPTNVMVTTNNSGVSSLPNGSATATTILISQRLPVLRPSSGSHGGGHHHHISTPASLDGTSAAPPAAITATAAAVTSVATTAMTTAMVITPANGHHTTVSGNSRPSTAQAGQRPIIATAATLGAAGVTSVADGSGMVKSNGVLVSAAPYERKIKAVSWYTRHFWVMRSRFMAMMIATMLTVCIIITIVIRFGEGNVPCHERQAWLFSQYGVVIAFCLGGAVPILVLAVKLSKHGRDNLGIKVELLAISAFIIVFGCVMVPLVSIYHSDRHKDEMQITGILIWGNTVWLPILAYPLALAYRHYRRQLRLAHDVQRSSQSLADFLKIPEARAAFMEFVSREFNAESLIFYTQASAFQTRGYAPVVTDAFQGVATAIGGMAAAVSHGNGTGTIALKPTLALPPPANHAPKPGVQSMAAIALKEAYSIYRSFVIANSPWEVNLSHATRRKIQMHLQTMTTAVAAAARDRNTSHYSHGPVSPNGNGNLTNLNNNNNSNGNGGNGGHGHREADKLLVASIRTTFDEAIDEILKLMSSNSFARYRASSAYRQLIETLQQQAEQPRVAWSGSAAAPPSNQHASEIVSILST